MMLKIFFHFNNDCYCSLGVLLESGCLFFFSLQVWCFMQRFSFLFFFAHCCKSSPVRARCLRMVGSLVNNLLDFHWRVVMVLVRPSALKNWNVMNRKRRWNEIDLNLFKSRVRLWRPLGAPHARKLWDDFYLGLWAGSKSAACAV